MNFINFIAKHPGNRRYLLVALAGIIAQFTVFKVLYPFADFFSDSYSYIYAASANLDINIWPIGYSKFLALFHWFTHSDTALVGFQYFFLEISALCLFFSLLYFFTLSRNSRIILFVFLFFNPLFLYISNYINSDPLFAALSLCWITQLIWIIQRPGLYQVFVQGILLFACFAVRNNAYYYPIIAAFAFMLSHQPVWRKLTGALLGLVFIIPFILYEREAAFKITGTRQFSLFTGWQLANNALYIRGNIDVASSKLPTAATRELDKLAANFYKRAPDNFNALLSDYVANFFIRQPEAPLKRYFSRHYRPHDEMAVIAAWGQASVVYESYGKYLITHYPAAFTRYFLLVNAKNYFLPPLEKLEKYNLGLSEVWPEAQQWFDYPSPKVKSISPTAQKIVLFLYPAFFLLVNLYCIAGGCWFLYYKKNLTVDTKTTRTLLLLGVLYLANAGFSIIATINVFRYQFFPMIICFSFSLLILELMSKQHVVKTKISGKLKYSI